MNHIRSNRQPVTAVRSSIARLFRTPLCNDARPYFSRGQSAVELALLAPLLVLVLVIPLRQRELCAHHAEWLKANRANVRELIREA